MSGVLFGPRWDAPQTDGATWIDTPVGQPCQYCDEPIEQGDQGIMQTALTGINNDVQPPEYTWRAAPAHAGCQAANLVGHTLGVCGCTGWLPGTKATGDEVWRLLGHGPAALVGPRDGKPHPRP